MNIIFLDFDGVICTYRGCVSVGEVGVFTYLDPVACNLVIQLIEKSGASVVISSTWRHEGKERLCGLLKSAGFSKIVNALHFDWKTPDLSRVKNACRGDEIAAWLEIHSDVDNYVILDDVDEMLDYQQSHFVQCDLYDGIGFRQYVRAIRLLGYE